MANKRSLVEMVQAKLDSGEVQLPVLNPVAAQLQDLLGESEFDLDKATELISHDQTLASQVLRMANSAFFSGIRKASTIQEAVVRLGARQAANLVTLTTQQAVHRSTCEVVDAYMKKLWQHSHVCAMCTQWLAGKTGYSELVSEALLAGLFHDIGKLFLMKVLEEIRSSGEVDISLSDPVVLEILDNLHAEQGYLLMQHWNLPESYCEVARDHHKADLDTSNPLLSLVRLSNAACTKTGINLSSDPTIVLAALPEAGALCLDEIRLAELEILIEDFVEDESSMTVH